MAAGTGLGDGFAIRFMLWVAGRTTCKLLLVGGTLCCQCFGLISMAGSTVFLRHVNRLQFYILWLMWRVTVHTVSMLHRLFVAFVAIGTNAGRGVLAVTVGAVLFAMATRHGSEIRLNLLMAADAHRRMRFI